MKKILYIVIIIFILLTIFSISQEKKKPVLLEPSRLDDNFSKEYISNVQKWGVKTINLGETKRITQTASFVDENSPFYLIIEEFSEGQNFNLPVGKFETGKENKIIYLKAKLEKKEGELGLMPDLIKYRIVGRACNLEKKICYESWDRQDPKIEDFEKEKKKNLNLRYYYVLATIPKDEKIDAIVLSHLSFTGGGFPPLGLVSSQTYDIPFFQFKLK